MIRVLNVHTNFFIKSNVVVDAGVGLKMSRMRLGVIGSIAMKLSAVLWQIFGIPIVEAITTAAMGIQAMIAGMPKITSAVALHRRVIRLPRIIRVVFI